eukprot:6133684-Prymnesium_polylepis.2
MHSSPRVVANIRRAPRRVQRKHSSLPPRQLRERASPNAPRSGRRCPARHVPEGCSVRPEPPC